MNVQRDFKFELVRKVSYKLVYVILVFVKVILDCLLQTFIELEGQVVILEDAVEN